jgi:hypothetical protein
VLVSLTYRQLVTVLSWLVLLARSSERIQRRTVLEGFTSEYQRAA